MNKLQNVLLGIALVLSVLGLILPRYSALPSLGGTTRDDIVLDVDTGRLTSGFALTVTGDESSFAGTRNSSGSIITGILDVTGAATLRATSTLNTSLSFSTSTSGIILEVPNAGGTCVRFGLNATGGYATTTVTCE